MSNEVNNLAASFVAMAQAFEELPKVKAELERAHADLDRYADQVQRLELRLIDRANELEAAHAATHKAEVERDHAETMFLETDSKLDQAKSVLKNLIGNAGEFLHVVEPPKPEPVTNEVDPIDIAQGGDGKVYDVLPPQEVNPYANEALHEPALQPQGQSADSPTDANSVASWTSQPSSAPDASAVSGESAASSTTDEALHHTATTSEDVNERIHANNELADRQGVSVPSDPTDNAGADVGSNGSPIASALGNTQSDAPEVASPSDPTPATESSSENASNASPLPNDLRPDPEPELRYSPEWYQWADRVGYWSRRAAQ